MIHYVVGLLFDPEFNHVVLIEKKRPYHLKGLLNGVGGKVNIAEKPHEAMVREFKEETGQEITQWNPLWVEDTQSYRIDFYWAVATIQARTTTDEPIHIVNTNSLPRNLAPSIHMLVDVVKKKNEYI